MVNLDKGTVCTINRSWGFLSSGTRVVVLSDPNVEWEKKGDTNSHGYVHVMLANASSSDIRRTGGFDIEIDYLRPVRNRTPKMVSANPRWKRRIGKERKHEPKDN